MEKLCNTCNLTKSLEDFSTRKLKNGDLTYRNECKQCRCAREKQRRSDNIEAFKLKDKTYYESNKDKILIRQKEYNTLNRDSICENKKTYYEANKDAIKAYHENSKDKRNTRLRVYRRKNPQANIINNIRTRIHNVLKSNKTSSTIELIGCDKCLLVNWIESQFDDRMSWDNYGSYWHLDHVIPLALFDLTNTQAQYMACHWSNCKPLEASKNISKSDNLVIDYIKEHIITLTEFITNNQTNYENSWWRRLELRNGNNIQDDKDFEHLLKWAIRIEDASEA